MPRPGIVNQTLRRKHAITTVLSEPVAWVNIALAFVSCALLAYYVISANGIASAQFEISRLANTASTLTEQTASLAAQQAALNDPTTLSVYAQEHQLVAVGADRETVFESGEVALGR